MANVIDRLRAGNPIQSSDEESWVADTNQPSWTDLQSIPIGGLRSRSLASVGIAVVSLAVATSVLWAATRGHGPEVVGTSGLAGGRYDDSTISRGAEGTDDSSTSVAPSSASTVSVGDQGAGVDGLDTLVANNPAVFLGVSGSGDRPVVAVAAHKTREARDLLSILDATTFEVVECPQSAEEISALRTTVERDLSTEGHTFVTEINAASCKLRVVVSGASAADVTALEQRFGPSTEFGTAPSMARLPK